MLIVSFSLAFSPFQSVWSWEQISGMEELRVRTPAEFAISELKEAVGDLLEENKLFGDDLYLLRWLKAQDMDVQKAEKMLRQAIISSMKWLRIIQSHHWRKTRAKEILHSNDTVDPELENFVSKHVQKSYCKSGAPIEFVDIGKFDAGKIFKKYGKDQFDKFLLEDALATEEKNILWNQKIFHESNNKVITENTLQGDVEVYDSKNLTLKQVLSVKNLQYAKQLAQDVKNYIPSLVSTVIIINCPNFAVSVVNLLKPLVESKHLRIECYGDNREVWREALLRHVHPDQLPVEYGGSMVSQENNPTQDLH